MSIPSESNRAVPLPANVELLSSQEVSELVTQRTNELESYVATFNPQEELKASIIELKGQLQELESKLRNLDGERGQVQERLEECRILESQYVKKWQDLHHKIDERYDEELLKAGLEIQMQEIEDASLKLEKELKDNDDLEEFLRQYIEMRTTYHVKREKLATWNSQGNLRMR